MKSLKKAFPVLFLIVSLICITNVYAEQTRKIIVSSGNIEYIEDKIVLKSYTWASALKDLNAATIAESFDMVQAGWWNEQKINQVKQIKPDFIALLYRIPKVIWNGNSDEWNMAVENDWLLKDINGNYIDMPSWSGHYIADIGNPTYQVWIANSINEEINQYGYDGVFSDVSLRVRVEIQFWGAASTPINPRTGTYWTDTEVKQAAIQLLSTIKNAIGSKLLVANGINRGEVFYDRFDDYNEVLSNSLIDGFSSEGHWYRYQGTWMSEENWLKSVDMIQWLQNNFLNVNPTRVFVATIKILNEWGGEDYPLPPGATKEQMATYAFTSTLLGAEHNQNYIFILADTNFTKEFANPLFNVIIGSPLNNYYIIGGTHIYARDFTRVKVLVNPTINPYTVQLNATFSTMKGEIVNEITMEPHTGIILAREN